MATKHLNGIDLYYETHGRGTPLLLIAGLASDSQSWLSIIKELSRHFYVITPDNRGVGRTLPQDVDITIQDMADDCFALINHLDLASVHVLGHSMGGFIAQDMAIRYPESVDKLILAGTSSSNSKRNNALFSDMALSLEEGMDAGLWVRNLFYWIFTPGFFENEGMVDVAVQFALNYPYPQSANAFRSQVQAITQFDCSKGLSNIRSKTLVITGKEDLIFPPDLSAVFAAAIPGAALSLIDKAAHSLHVEQPESFVGCVLKFLTGN